MDPEVTKNCNKDVYRYYTDKDGLDAYLRCMAASENSFVKDCFSLMEKLHMMNPKESTCRVHLTENPRKNLESFCFGDVLQGPCYENAPIIAEDFFQCEATPYDHYLDLAAGKILFDRQVLMKSKYNQELLHNTPKPGVPEKPTKMHNVLRQFSRMAVLDKILKTTELPHYECPAFGETFTPDAYLRKICIECFAKAKTSVESNDRHIPPSRR
jgi:hypothetical protein